MRRHQVEAVAGWHLSALREVLAPCVAPHVPYVYSALYEGGERTPGVFLTGETPASSCAPRSAGWWRAWGYAAGPWSGTTTCGPAGRLPARTLPGRVRRRPGRGGLCAARNGRLPGGPGTARPQRRRRGPDAAGGAGRGAVQPAVRGVRPGRAVCRLSPLITEDMLLASGATRRAASTRPPATSSRWSPRAAWTSARGFTRRFGADAPSLNSPGESCYEACGSWPSWSPGPGPPT